MPDKLASVLIEYKKQWKFNAQGFLFTTRNGRPPSSNKVVEYQLWPILDALGIARCGLHAFHHSVASFIVDAGYSSEGAQKQLPHATSDIACTVIPTDSRTTQGYIHMRGADSLQLDGKPRVKGQYIQ